MLLCCVTLSGYLEGEIRRMMKKSMQSCTDDPQRHAPCMRHSLRRKRRIMARLQVLLSSSM
jgi:hypothetical protein